MREFRSFSQRGEKNEVGVCPSDRHNTTVLEGRRAFVRFTSFLRETSPKNGAFIQTCNAPLRPPVVVVGLLTIEFYSNLITRIFATFPRHRRNIRSGTPFSFVEYSNLGYIHKSITMTSRTSYPLGSRVILQGLTKGTEFNGKVGVIKSKLKDERQQVLLIQSGKTLGIKPLNIKYEPRTVNSLSVSELKILLKLKDVTQLSGYDKSQLREMVKIKTESEEEIADLLYTHLEKEKESSAAAGSSRNGNGMNPSNDPASALNLTPDQMRQQAQMLRTMPPSQIRRMNPQMAGFSDAQIQMAANQMEMMANNPAMLQQMKDQVKNMSPEELEQVRQQAAKGGAGAVTGTPGAAGAPGTGSAPTSVADMTPEQLKQQATMMKSMTPDQIRSMNPAMAKWGDAQIQMAIQQMETMASNPDMMKSLSDQMKGMKQEDIEKMQKMAADGFPGGAPGGAGTGADGLPSNPMDMLNSTNPAQLKNMLKMVKENPSLMRDMLRSSNPAMADQMTDEQIEKTIGAFADMDENKIGWVIKMIGWANSFKNSSKAKILLFLFLSMIVFVFGMLIYLVKSQKGAVEDGALESEEIPPVPVIDSEF